MSVWTWRLGVAMVILAISVLALPYAVHGDVRYAIGVQAVSGQSAAFTFAHRPLLYRLITAMYAWPAETVTTTVRASEIVLRAEAAAITLGVCVLLWFGLRRHRPKQALPIAGVVFAALLLMSPSGVLQPDWFAVVLTVGGTGAALAGRRDGVPAVAGGVFLAAAAAVKVVTLPVALIGLLAIATISRRRALIALVAASAAGLLYLAAVAIWLPHEIGWMMDMRLLQPEPRPLGTQLGRVAEYLVNIAVLWPLVVMIPAAAVGLPTRHQLAVAAAAALALAPALIQNQFSPYQSPALPVVAASVVTLAIGRSPRRTVPMVFLLVVAGWTAWVLATPVPRLPERLPVWVIAAGVIGLAAWLWQRHVTRVSAPDGRSAPLITSALAAAVTFLATASPVAAQSVSLRGTEAFNPAQTAKATERKVKTAAQIQDTIGPHSTVTYLTFGDMAYFLRNPTNCRYPSPVFLQRSRSRHRQEGSRSWAETLACIQDSPGQWLLWDTAWFGMAGQPPEVKDVLVATFDCARGVKIGSFRICPRHHEAR